MKNKFNCFLFGAFLFAKSTAMACTSSSVLSQIPVTFHYNHHSHYLGLYRINLKPVLTAIKYRDAYPGFPYYQKKWWGSCPRGLHGKSGSCIEFTVYPDDINFSPHGIMHKIEKYTHGKMNRGEVRILTNHAMTEYVYTTNHERKFCGPYKLSR